MGTQGKTCSNSDGKRTLIQRHLPHEHMVRLHTIANKLSAESMVQLLLFLHYSV